MRPSKILVQIGNTKIGLLFVPFLLKTYNISFFPIRSKFSYFRQSLEIINSGVHVEFAHSFIIRTLSILSPWALFGSKLLVILEIALVEKLNISSHLLASFPKNSGKTLLLFNTLHCFSKKSVKKFRFCLKICYEYIFMKQRKYTSNFLIF